jgi:hypothetical protein
MLTYSSRRIAASAAIERAVWKVRVSVADREPETMAAFERLLYHIRRRSSLLRWSRSGGRLEAKGFDEVVCALLALATHHEDWLRPVESWERVGDNTIPQFSSLARHLLADYPVPAFMTSVWFRGQCREARRLQCWFKQIGIGKNIRTADLPLPYTKKMAHHFLQAPDHFTVESALRWGQVRGLGGSERLAHAIIATRLGRLFEAHDFWLTVVQFFVNHPAVEFTPVGSIVEYLHNQRFVPQDHFELASGDVVSRPPQPDLSMKGRTPRSLLRLVETWQKDVGLRSKKLAVSWSPGGIGGFRLTEPGIAGRGMRSWSIRELLSSAELRAEGSAMHHCVASYTDLCQSGLSSIWSMMVEDHKGRRRVLTIDIIPISKTVVEARRCCNADPNPRDREILELWAQQEGLKVNC